MKNIMDEIWRPVEGYEGLYEVSNTGKVKSLERYKKNGSKLQLVPEIELKQDINKYRNGYHSVHLSKDGKVKTIKVYQLVVKAFPEICGEWFEGCEIDHLNTITSDNNARNLRVTTKKGNMNNPLTKINCSKGYTDERRLKYSQRMKENNPSYNKELWTKERRKKCGLSAINKRIKVIQLSKENVIIRRWDSFSEIEKETGFSASNVCKCCIGKQKSSYGFKWKYA